MSCHLTVGIFPDRIEATLTDSGAPGGVELVARPMPDALAESGRGIPIIQALVDDLDYCRADGVNRWHISRRIQGSSS